MATRATRDAPAAAAGAHASLTTAMNTAQAVLAGSGLALFVLGFMIWSGRADDLVSLHLLIGVVLMVSLWTIAAIAARSGVSGRLVGAAVCWSVMAPVLGTTQATLLAGDLHWTVQVLHLLIGLGVIAWGRLLVVMTRRAAG